MKANYQNFPQQIEIKRGCRIGRKYVLLDSVANETRAVCMLKLYCALLFSLYVCQSVHRNLEKQECSISEADAVEYSNCREKMQWMEKEWRTHKCYAFYGVNGTSYLSEVEKYCPVLSWRKIVKNGTAISPENRNPEMKRILSGLLKLMFDNELNYKFIRTRITLLWPKWLSAYNELMIKWPKVVSLQRKLNIIMHMGSLSRESGFKFGQLSSTGGPLGELVQWSDLIAALYLLGHNLMISTEVRTLKKNIKKIDDICPCPLHDREVINLLFTDIVGLKYLRGKMKDFFNRMKCKLRILDSFGTHAEFNSRIYFAAHKNLLGGSRKNPWGNHQLDLQQFMTMYPHTDDNTFLGFVMEMDPVKQDIKKNNITLVLRHWKLLQTVLFSSVLRLIRRNLGKHPISSRTSQHVRLDFSKLHC
ncbi:Glycosyltransferase 18 family protein [Brugia pahangi]